MKASFKLFLVAGVCACLAVSCQKYDDTQIRNDISSLSSRVATLENWKNTAQGNIQSLLTLTEGLNKNYFITAINTLEDGYEFVFSNGSKATIKNGHSPAIGVKKDTDGEYYWTLDGEWLLDTGKNKIRVTGEPPQLKIDGGFWYVSTNQGASWAKLGQATGDKGDKGDSMFKEVTYDANFVYLVLADGTSLKVSRGANGVQAIAAMPDYADGSVQANQAAAFVIRFKIVPETAAESLGVLADGCFKLDALYTLTKSSAGDRITIPITNRTIADGVLTLTGDKSALEQFFHSSVYGLSVSLTINDGVVAVTSPYVPLYNSVSRIFRGHEYVEMGDGIKWATCNLGASKPEEYGDYYAWAEWIPYYQEGHAYDNPCTDWKSGMSEGYKYESYYWVMPGYYDDNHIIRYTFKDNHYTGVWYSGTTFMGDDGDGKEHKDLASYDYIHDAAHRNWGTGWRIPTDAEWTVLRDTDKFDWTWTNDYKGIGVCGMIVTSKVPGFEGNSIFLPAAGNRYGLNLQFFNSYGFYWSSSLHENESFSARSVTFTTGSPERDSGCRYYGQSIRPVTE